MPPEGDQPSWVADTVRMVKAGLAGGVSPGFKVPPPGVVPDAEAFEPEPGNPAVQVRVINSAVLHELSVVTRPAYSSTEIDARGQWEMFHPLETGKRRRRTPSWL